MSPRVTWKGSLNVSLVSLAVKAYTATAPENGQLRLNQLHAACHGRIKYEKTCPLHGAVASDQIVMGYQYAQDQYVQVDLAELDKLRCEEEKRAIRIDTFAHPEQVEAVCHTERHYYLLPDGALAGVPYGLLHQAMRDKGVHAVGQLVLAKREQLVLIRPLEKLFLMTVLKYASQVRLPSCFGEEVAAVSTLGQEELSLAETLIESRTSRQLEMALYKDEYAQKLERLIEAKVAGEQLVAAPASEPRHVLSLLDALKASVAQAGPTAAVAGARNELAGQLSRTGGKGKRRAAKRKKTAKGPVSRKAQKKTA